MSNEPLEERINDDKKSILRSINTNKLKKIGRTIVDYFPYAGAAILGAGVSYLVGEFSGKSIARLMGVKSQFMGIETDIAGYMIKYTLTTAGAVLGVSGVYLYNRSSKKNSL